MIKLSFQSSEVRSWVTSKGRGGTVHVCGWAFKGGSFLPARTLSEYIHSAVHSMPFSDIVSALNGNFAIVFDGPDAISLGVDAVRSIPLFYRREGTNLEVSDDIRALHRSCDAVDGDSLVEYATAGIVTGPHTLFSTIKGLQAGEVVSCLDSGVRSHRYYRYICSYDADLSVDELKEAFDEVIMATFGRLVESLNGQQLIIPLSGGLDSRLVASTLKHCGYDNVLCLWYGKPGNLESERSRFIADTLGYTWIQVPYSAGLWRKAMQSPGMRDYWVFSSNAVSIPHCDDWLAIRELRENRAVSEDGIVVPGHTGDFICGGHLKYVFDPLWQDDSEKFVDSLIKKHYSMWDHLVACSNVRAVITRRLEEALGVLPKDADEDEEVARKYELWEWQERQAKFVVNSVRSYEFFGFSWRIPLWDQAVVEFWKRVPLSLKMEKFLYRTYLVSHDPLLVFQGEAPKGLWNREQILESRKNRIRRRLRRMTQTVIPSESLWANLDKVRKHLFYYRYDPLGFPSAFGMMRYILLELSKRHHHSLILKEVLRSRYDIDLTQLRDVLESESEVSSPG